MVSCQSTETERTVWANHYSFSHVTGTAICLSCLLEAGRGGEVLLGTYDFIDLAPKGRQEDEKIMGG